MSHVIILARTTREGNDYARANRSDLPTGRHIVPTSAAQILGTVPHLVIELPGFRSRRDCHAILTTLKRSTKKYQKCEWRVVRPPVDFGRELWVPQSKPQWQRDLDAKMEPEGWVPPDTLTAEEILRLAAGETGAEVVPMEGRDKAKRRSRCKICHALHIAGEPCPPDPFGDD